MRSVLRGLCVGVLSLLLTSSLAWGQATAELSGRVADESGAVLPGVTVTATQTDTGFTRTVVTDATGTYAMPNLPTGPYRLEVSLQGFRTYIQTGIVLQVGATPTINAVLAVGSLEETVAVEAATPLVDVRSAGISEVVEQERIVELPLQGRQVTDLIVLAGAAVETGRPNNRSFQGGVNISVAGGQDFGVAYLLDGTMHNDVQNSGGLPLPFPDALQEFSVATSGLSAQNGMHSGASVSAVTRSGTNAFHGNAFEFLRTKRFNAKSPFAPLGLDGKRRDDGLLRNQFGGTVGGPIVRDKLFFFGAYQGTPTRVSPPDTLANVPTAAMMAGDFTAFTSPACNGGRQITLRAPFVNNRIDPALFSPASVNMAKRLPQTTDPCGEIRFTLPNDRDEAQLVGRIDYQATANHSVFGRYMPTFDNKPSGLSKSDNVLTTVVPNIDNMAQSLTLGETAVLGANMVNALRFAFNQTTVNRFNEDYFEPSDLGMKVYNYSPTRELSVAVNGGFTISALTGTRGIADNKAYQLSDDLTVVRGRHQFGLGANVAFWRSLQKTYARSSGEYVINGQATGLGLADFVLGRLATFEQGTVLGLLMNQWYLGLYVQDAWRATNRVTVNAGLRWEPLLGQNIEDGPLANFSLDNFHQGVKSTLYKKAPPGVLYPGDPGFPPGTSGFYKQWWNLSPRAGVAWDVTGDGRTAVRASYGLMYDFVVGDLWFGRASAPPRGANSKFADPPGLWDDPYAHIGGNPHPIVVGPDTVYLPFSTIGALDPHIRSPRIQSWNVTVEQQLGANWGVSASYLGSYSDRLWGTLDLNPGVFLGLGPCTIQGVSYPVCSATSNLDYRRVLYQENPRDGQFIGYLDLFDDVGTATYRGLKLSAQRRSASGLSVNGNYTWSRCFGLEMFNGTSAFGTGFVKPGDPDYDRGHCTPDRTHLANFTMGYQTPQLTSALLRALASDWRLSGILNARSGSWLSVTTGQDTAFTGRAITAQRVNQVSDDVYGEKTLNRYLNRDAFAQPAPGTFGDSVRNSIKGPGFWKVDLALSRLFSFGGTQGLEIRVEAFNLLNNFNWGNPVTNFNAATFGRILIQTGDPRIMQFGVKYGF